MTSTKSQNSNMLLAFLTLLGVIAIVAVVGFFMLRKQSSGTHLRISRERRTKGQCRRYSSYFGSTGCNG